MMGRAVIYGMLAILFASYITAREGLQSEDLAA